MNTNDRQESTSFNIEWLDVEMAYDGVRRFS
jgi:hypothetical protein